MRTILPVVILLVAAGFPSRYSRSAEPDLAARLPRVAPLEPEAALASFVVQPPFRIELVASEPLLADPVAAAFDENLRLYVVEMRDYSEDREGRLGQVRLLEDTDQDGRFDKTTVFVDQLSWPTAVACWQGGVFIGAAPDILYCRDTDGDGRADERRVVFNGFGRDNVQGLLNSFQWGLDNRIHGAASSCGGLIRRLDDANAQPVDVRGRDFAFDPRTLRFEATSGGGQHGMSFDDWGRKFVSSNSDHLQQVMFEERDIARNPLLAAPSPRVSIAADGPQAEVFRISPVERWRELRTRLRVAGTVPGPIEGGGRAAGYFTGATGVTIYRGDAWPKEFHGLAIVGDVGSNIVHRKRLEPNGVEFIGRRIDEKCEFVASTDIWFRPAQFLNGPDGALYVLDVYREVIEHPDSLPPMIKRHLDLTSGNDRGRIYRIVPVGFTQPRLEKLGSKSTKDLVQLLEHANGWHRDTVARLLYERQDKSAVPELEQLLATTTSPLVRMHALHVLAGLHALSDESLVAGLNDADPRVAMHAIRLSERRINRNLLAAFLNAARGDDSELACSVAFRIADAPRSLKPILVEFLALSHPGDRWLQLAMLSSMADDAGTIGGQLVKSASAAGNTNGVEFLARLAELIGRGNDRDGRELFVSALVDASPKLGDRLGPVVEALCRGAAARERNPLSLPAISDERLRTLMTAHVDAALKSLADPQAETALRINACDTTRWLAWKDVRKPITGLLDPRSPHELQLAALRTIAFYDDPAAAEPVLAAWPTLGPGARAAALETLFSRPAYTRALLEAVEQSALNPRDLDAARVKQLREHPDEDLRARAQSLLTGAETSSRADVLERYRTALELTGNATRGREAFGRHCAACHRVNGIGYEIAPNLAAMRNRGAEAILTNVLDPNREVNPQYVNYTVLTADGRALSGIVASESGTSITLRRGEGAEETVLRADIERIQSTGLSLMPEGLDQQLDQQALADVMAFVMLENEKMNSEF